MRSSVFPDVRMTGVCSRLAQFFRCNVWVLRAGFILLLMIKTLFTLIVYGSLFLLFRVADYCHGPGRAARNAFSLDSPQLASRDRRIRDLDRRFREWEDSLRH